MKDKQEKHKHLTDEQREFIEVSLNSNLRITEIARLISKDRTTISKEIRRNRTYKEASKHGGYSNICINRINCTKTLACNKRDCHNNCSSCSICNQACNLFIPELCAKLSKAPYVCNSCEKKSSCRLEKFYYRAKDAESKYQKLKRSSREGLNLTTEQLGHLNTFFEPVITKGQPINHIYANHKAEIPCAISTFYRYVDKGALSIKNIDLRRKVKYKPRKKRNSITLRKNSKLLVGRSYSDFKSYICANPHINVVEMDVVEGTKGGKVLLTLFFRNSHLMLIFLLDEKTQKAVLEVFDKIELLIGTENFIKTFPIILTDNGSEFSDPVALEESYISNFKRTSIFYCDPQCSWQKPGVEKNHEFIRYVIPKGKSMNGFSEQQIALLMNHINSTARKELNDSAPIDLANLLLPKTTIEKLDLIKILADDVCLTPKLLR